MGTVQEKRETVSPGNGNEIGASVVNRAAFKPRRRIKGVLFDFDGTLTFPGALDFPAIKRELNCPPDMPVLEFIETQPAEKKPSLLGILEMRETQGAAQSRPNAGAEHCLAELKRRGILLGIHTRNSRQSVQQGLEKFETARIGDFKVVMTRDDCLPKPHPDGVIKASGLMGLPIVQLMVVGDFRFDIMAGKTAGACTVLITNGKTPGIAPEDPEPDYIINHLEEVLNLIECPES
jgi:hydrogenase expression/formation protein HypE